MSTRCICSICVGGCVQAPGPLDLEPRKVACAPKTHGGIVSGRKRLKLVV